MLPHARLSAAEEAKQRMRSIEEAELVFSFLQWRADIRAPGLPDAPAAYKPSSNQYAPRTVYSNNLKYTDEVYSLKKED
jgi:hypothetical protein